MPTPYRTEGLVLTDGTSTVDLRTKLHDCHDWFDLLAGAPKRGRNRTVPGVRGRAIRPRYGDELRGVLQVLIDGAWTVESTPHVGDRLENMQAGLHLLLDLVDGDDPLTVTVHQTGSLPVLAGILQVEDPGRPRFEAGRFCRLVLDVTLPAGRLQVAP
jgi:hypothetical protein